MATMQIQPPEPVPLLVEMVKAAHKPKKKLIRRLVPDNSQRIRRTVQIAFILLNVFIGDFFGIEVVLVQHNNVA